MSVGKSLAWMGMSQFAAVLLQFGAQVVLVRILTLHEAGIYAVALAVVGVLSLLQTLGLQALIVREEELTPELIATTFTVNAIISILLSISIVAVSYLGAAFLGDAGVQRVLSVLALTPLIAIFSFQPSALLERQGRFREIAISGTLGSVIGAILTIVLALMGFSYMSAAWAQCANALIVTITMLFLGRGQAPLRIGFQSWRRVAYFGFQMLAISGISNLGARLSDIILGRLQGLSALGLYSRASGLNGLIWTNLHLLVGRVMLVDYSELHRQGASLRERYIQTVDLLTAFLWPVFAGFAVLAGPFIQIVYGAKWVPAATPLVFIALASIVQIAITMTYELFAATGRIATQTRIEFIRAIIALIAFAGGCMISLEAAAAARVIDALFAVILYRPFLNSMTDTRFADFIPIYARSTLLTLIAIAPASLILAWHGWSAETSPLALGGGVVLGGLLWIGTLFAIRHPLIAEAGQLIRRRKTATA